MKRPRYIWGLSVLLPALLLALPAFAEDPPKLDSGDTAWIAYVNQGSITDASGTVSQKWLESAFLQKKAGIWRIAFLHSTRVPEALRQNPAQ